MKVLLVHRGEPFSFPRTGVSSLVPPFVLVQTVWPEVKEGWSTLPAGYSVYILPCGLFRTLGKNDYPGLCLVYGEPDEALSCVEAGAVDFMREGWNLHELGARLYRLWRPGFVVNGLVVSMRGDRLESGGLSVNMSPAGASLLRILLARRNCPVPAGALETATGGGEGPKALPMRISRLRARISRIDPSLGDRIRSCGRGAYCFLSDE